MNSVTTLSFGQPDGRLELNARVLDHWAEHLTWCCRIMGVPDDAMIGVIDFGTSPVAFLGSSLLTPMLSKGLAERLPGHIICLDASRERVALVPSILRQVDFDVLIVRDDVLPALMTYCREAGQSLDDILIVITFGPASREAPVSIEFRKVRRMLVSETEMLMAPECPECGRLHLRASHYHVAQDLERIVTRGCEAVSSLPRGLAPEPPHCPRGSEDWLLLPCNDGDPL